jgi:hypothetical protein
MLRAYLKSIEAKSSSRLKADSKSVLSSGKSLLKQTLVISPELQLGAAGGRLSRYTPSTYEVNDDE